MPGIPQRSSVSATVERGLSFLWFNWARNHFRCNTRADAAAMSSNHRKSSTSLSPTRSLYSTIIYLPCRLSPFNPTLYVESKKPPSFQSSRVEHTRIDFAHSDRQCFRDAFSVIKTVARLYKEWHYYYCR